MIELYKMVTGKYDTAASINFKFISYLGTQTRGNKYKIFQDHVKYNLRISFPIESFKHGIVFLILL